MRVLAHPPAAVESDGEHLEQEREGGGSGEVCAIQCSCPTSDVASLCNPEKPTAIGDPIWTSGQLRATCHCVAHLSQAGTNDGQRCWPVTGVGSEGVVEISLLVQHAAVEPDAEVDGLSQRLRPIG